MACQSGALLEARTGRGLRSSGCRIGWGYRPSGQWAQRAGKSRFRLFEDAFVRSLRPGKGRGAVFGVVCDREGMYYDPAGRSELHGMLNRAALSAEGGSSRVTGTLERFLALGVSKYNWFPGEYDDAALDEAMPEEGVLVVDQTRGDVSLTSCGIGPGDFEGMLRAALEENIGEPVYVRTHPDRIHRGKLSCLPESCLHWPRVRVVGPDLSPAQVLSRVRKVYVMGSLLGLEAILRGKQVIHFGKAFYGGWGLTEDRREDLCPRAGKLTRERLFETAYLDYCRWFDPATGAETQLERILDHLERQKRLFAENAAIWAADGFSAWKRGFVSDFVRSPAGTISWDGKAPGARPLKWGTCRAVGDNEGWRVEDGFLRSIGLGAEFRRPLSLVFDDLGMYYDARQESRLERILREHDWTGDERDEASRLIGEFQRRGLSKYNLSNSTVEVHWPAKPGQARILVAGQVESDASLRLGLAPHESNLAFLRAVRRLRPDASLAYKPHPDVVRRLRDGGDALEALREACDLVIEDLGIGPWLRMADEVQVQTSLTGFEALLNDKPVVCHGVPFYSGWGLTTDLGPVPDRRGRRLTLAELVHGTLVQYPRYVHPETGEFIDVFEALRLLEPGRENLFRPPRFLSLLARAKRQLGIYPRCAAHRRERAGEPHRDPLLAG